jgi:hypothetical protein
LRRAACVRRGLHTIAATAAAAGSTSSSGGPAPRRNSIDAEILLIALPTIATLAADPLAGLVSTAFIGRLGASPLASAGVALSVYNSITKMLNMPLLAVTTSSVAQALGAQQGGNRAVAFLDNLRLPIHLVACAAPRCQAQGAPNRKSMSAGGEQGSEAALATAVSASLVLALITGAVQAALLAGFGCRGLALWGAAPGGPLYADAAAYLQVRALAAPATVLMLVLQGCFRCVRPGAGGARVRRGDLQAAEARRPNATLVWYSCPTSSPCHFSRHLTVRHLQGPGRHAHPLCRHPACQCAEHWSGAAAHL